MPYKRARSPFYWIAYTDPETGKQVCKSSGTAVFAEAKALEQTLRASAHYDKQRSKTDIRLSDVLAEYLAPRLTPVARSTAKHLAELSELWCSELTPAVLRTHIKKRQAEGAQPGTINKELVFLSAAINSYNLDNDTAIGNPVKGLKLREPEGRLRYLTRDEYARLVSATDGYLRDFIILGVQTGMRRGELNKLRWDRVDLEQGLINLRSEDTKAGKPRSIPLNQEARSVLGRRQADKKNDYVFPSTKNPDTFLADPKRSFRSATERAGLEDVTPHILRHTTASWMAMAGIPMLEIQKILGHSSMQVTMRYAHLAPSHLRSAVDALV